MGKHTHNLDAEWAEFKATGSLAARNRIIEMYVPLVNGIAASIGKRLPKVVEHDDLVSYGTFGLIEAAKRFEPERGLQFTTYAGKRIYYAIIDGLRQSDWIPRMTRHRTKLLAEAVATFEAEQGRPPTRDEVRRRLKLTKDKFQRFESDHAVAMVSLSRPMLDCPDGAPEQTELDCLHDERQPAPDHRAHCNEVIAVIIREFPLTDSLLLKMYFFEGMTLVEIADALGGLTESAMSIRKKQLMDRLRSRFQPHVLHRLKVRAA
jgi:RNA polymerase sigma factor for flagellar operon FliA